jgi:hypothetical protein
MCRSIKPLFNYDPPASEEEIRAAALQYVRKIGGFTRPSQVNQAAFEAAVVAVATASQAYLAALQTNAPPRNREAETIRAQAHAARRFSSAQSSSGGNAL